MGKKLYLSIFLLVIGFSSLPTLSAQAPGYLGKKNIARLHFDIAPAIAYGLSENLWGPNFRYGLQIEHVLSRQFSVGAEYQRFSNRVRYDDRMAVMGEGVGLARVHAQSIGLQARMYQFRKKGNIAPLGPFQYVAVSYVNYQVVDLDGRYPPGGLTDLGRFGDLILSVGAGTQRMLTERITGHVGAQMGTIASIFGTNFGRDVPPQDLGASRIARNVSLTVNFGVGLLLF